jgi:branched-chain amino acid transport system ATP-binding protein
MLSVNNITVKYDNFIALSELSLHVEEKEAIALIGPNGAGKTTLLRAITGLKQICAGSIEYYDKRIDDLRPDQVISLKISMAAEGHKIFPYMSVEENLKMGTYSLKDKNEIQKGLENSYSLFKILGDRKHQLAGTLSGGEQQMLAIGTAMACNPRLLILDEPSLGLAPKVNEEIACTLDVIKHQGITILLSEQNAKVAMDISDRVYILQNGRIVVEDSPENLSNNPEVSNLYLAVY